MFEYGDEMDTSCKLAMVFFIVELSKNERIENLFE